MVTVFCVYSRVVDISKEKPFFVFVVKYFITAALCEYVYKGSPCWFLPLELYNMALFTPHAFLISRGDELKTLECLFKLLY